MKVILFILLFTTSAHAQFTAPLPDSGYWFSKSEVITSVNKIQKLQAKSSLCDSLFAIYQNEFRLLFLQVGNYREQLQNKDEVIKLQAEQILLSQKNDSLYQRAIDNLKPSIFDNFWLHIAIGAIAGILLYKNFLK